VRKAADSSVTVAALLADHPAHEAASEALAACRATIAHAAVETYSVLTRLPMPHRVDAATAATVLEERTPAPHAALDASTYAEAPARLATAGVSGGATYDGLIALVALEHDLELLTRDKRAVRTYRALDVTYQLLD
jgi:predicted nucleic acid-binding protein